MITTACRWPRVLMVLLGGCLPAAPGDEAGGPGKVLPAQAENPGVTDTRPSVPLVEPDQRSWAVPDSVAAVGNGPCAGVTLGRVLDQVRAQFEEVRGIDTFRGAGPRGFVMTAPPPVPAGEPPPPATETRAYVIGFVDARSFGAVFFRGDRCRADQCEDRQYWYFETDDRCQPRWVGHHRAVDRPGGRYGTCVDVTGSPLWHHPSAPGARRRCDVDWSPQDISGTRQAWSLTGGPTCWKSEGIVPVEVTIVQQADRAQATIQLHGTGIPFVDGRTFSGKVERQSFAATFEERSAGACPTRREIEFNLDYEDPSINGIPGGLGLVDVTEQPVGPCPTPAVACSASLHLVRRN